VRDAVEGRQPQVNKILAVFALLCVFAPPKTPQTKTLVAKSRIPISVVGEYLPGNIAFPTVCDGQGRFYVKLIKPGLGMVGPLFRFSSKGVAEAEFDTSGELINRYAVRPDSGVVMMRLDRGKKVVDNFGPDGTRESSVYPENPPIPFFPSQLAVFPSGDILISGMQYRAGPSYKASTAIYSPAGHLVKQFALEGDAQIEREIDAGDGKDTDLQKRHSEAVDKSVAITADDGLVYLMRASSPATVYAISDAGDVVRRIVVSAPTGTGSPDFGIRVVKNRLVVQFRRTCEGDVGTDSCRSSTYAVVDATTGQKLAAYESDREAAGTLACYAPDPDRFFIFSGRKVLDIVVAGAT
jgi:hypothetical protein